MRKTNYSAESSRLSGKSGLPYSKKFRNAVDTWLAQIWKITKVIYGTRDNLLLERIDDAIDMASQQLFAQFGRQDIEIDNKMTGLADYARHYVECLCPNAQGRQDLMDTLGKYWSDVLLTGICAGQPASVEQSCYVMCQYQYRVFYAVMKKGKVPTPY